MLCFSIVLLLCIQANAFNVNPSIVTRPISITSITALDAKKKKPSSSSGKGFGKPAKSVIKVRQTYGTKQNPKDVLIDMEGAMENFFRDKEEWHSLFVSIASSDDVPGLDFIDSSIVQKGEKVTFDQNDETTPWKELPAVPSGDDREELMPVIAKVLDSWQQALVDIPVNEASKEDSDDLHFLEEGRRILCIQRFQVLANNEFLSANSAIEKHDILFRTCWSEILYLMTQDIPDTGSLIILPEDYDLNDLKQFTDMNILRPLEWLGIDSTVMEVASLQRESPCIRLLHKLSDIPDLKMRDAQLKADEE